MNNTLEVKQGVIYTKEGIPIESMSIILDRPCMHVFYGDAKEGIKQVYYNRVSSYKRLGVTKLEKQIIYKNFEDYSDNLTVQNICTFVNYLIAHPDSFEDNSKLLRLPVDDLKQKLQELSELGF